MKKGGEKGQSRVKVEWERDSKHPALGKSEERVQRRRLVRILESLIRQRSGKALRDGSRKRCWCLTSVPIAFSLRTAQKGNGR